MNPKFPLKTPMTPKCPQRPLVNPRFPLLALVAIVALAGSLIALYAPEGRCDWCSSGPCANDAMCGHGCACALDDQGSGYCVYVGN